MSNASQRLDLAGVSPPLVLLEQLPIAETAPSHAAVTFSAPEILPITPASVSAPVRFNLPQEPAEIALAISSSTDVTISDANAGEVARTLETCGGQLKAGTPRDQSLELTLLVRVEKNGHVSDSKVEVGSGAKRLDETTQHCLLAQGHLSPRILNGEPVVSWQRVRWSARELGTRT